MKSYCTTQKAIKKAMNDEWKTKQDEHFELCKKGIVPQVMAMCMYALKIRYGFGEKRMNDFFDEVKAMSNIMENGNVFGKTFTSVDLIHDIKNKYGIDLDVEFGYEDRV